MDAAAIVVDDAYVISDLHLGGEAPFQIFREGAALALLIGQLADTAPPQGGSRALVINGDFVDFLAEKPARHFDAEGATGKLARIVADPSFAPVFDALRRYVARPGHRLAIVLGNHDVELALPWVQQALESHLCGADDACRGRIVWSLDGRGVLLRIGSATGPRVLCVHGNEVDGWNVVEHEVLRKMGRDGLRDQPIAVDYVPNAGARMVIEVMNGIKQRYPFVDLLKPETEAVVPTLMALDPKAAAALAALPGLVARQQADRGRIAAGLLGDGSMQAGMAGMVASGLPPAQPAAPRPRAVTAPGSGAGRDQVARQLLDRAEDDFMRDRMAVDLLGESRTDTLGWMGAAWAAASGGDRVDVLRAKLLDLSQDRTFQLDDRDDTFTGLDTRVSTNIDFLVTGHTHLARALVREAGRSYYFNTGTWARVFRLTPQTLASDTLFRAAFAALGSNRIDALDAAPGLEPVRPHMAAFWHDTGGVHGELRTIAAVPPHAVSPVVGTLHTRL